MDIQPGLLHRLRDHECLRKPRPSQPSSPSLRTSSILFRQISPLHVAAPHTPPHSSCRTDCRTPLCCEAESSTTFPSPVPPQEPQKTDLLLRGGGEPPPERWVRKTEGKATRPQGAARTCPHSCSQVSAPSYFPWLMRQQPAMKNHKKS